MLCAVHFTGFLGFNAHKISTITPGCHFWADKVSKLPSASLKCPGVPGINVTLRMTSVTEYSKYTGKPLEAFLQRHVDKLHRPLNTVSGS